MIYLTRLQRKEAGKKIRRLYELNRPVTDKEIDDELESLVREEKRGTLDDFQELLVATLSTGNHPIKISEVCK